jgi:DNA-binding Lrp family transcriptional regulator
VELDIKDSKLLLELDRNARQPISALAKKTGLSREVVQYRMKRLEETGVISRYTTIVDFHKIGFSQYKIYLKLQHISGEKYREILEHMIQNQDIKWVAECNGRWDLIVASITKTLVEFDGVKNDLFHRFAPFIAEKSITAMVSYYSKPRTYLLPKPPHEKPLRVESLQLPISINETDLRLLRLLGENSRQSVIELSRKLGVSPRIVAYRIQWFESSVTSTASIWLGPHFTQAQSIVVPQKDFEAARYVLKIADKPAKLLSLHFTVNGVGQLTKLDPVRLYVDEVQVGTGEMVTAEGDLTYHLVSDLKPGIHSVALRTGWKESAQGQLMQISLLDAERVTFYAIRKYTSDFGERRFSTLYVHFHRGRARRKICAFCSS